MRNKAKEFSYSSREPFLEDIRLIRDNCIKFCEGRFPNMPPVADELLAEAQDKVARPPIRGAAMRRVAASPPCCAAARGLRQTRRGAD